MKPSFLVLLRGVVMFNFQCWGWHWFMIAYMPPVQNPAVGGAQHSSSAVHHWGRFVDSFDFITYTITYKISLCSTVPFSPSTLAILSHAKPSCILQVGRILKIIQFSPLGTDRGRIATKRYNKLCMLRFAVLQTERRLESDFRMSRLWQENTFRCVGGLPATMRRPPPLNKFSLH